MHNCCWRDSWPHFTISDSRLPQSWGHGARIYIPQEQGGPVITPGTGFPLNRPLRLAGLRWKHLTPPLTHGLVSWIQISLHSAYNTSAQTTVENTVFNSLLLHVDPLLWRHVCLQLLPSNGCTCYNVNDTLLTPGVCLGLFADDTYIYVTDHKGGYVFRKLQWGLSTINMWYWRWNVKNQWR
jgi:hypothetical protein